MQIKVLSIALPIEFLLALNPDQLIHDLSILHISEQESSNQKEKDLNLLFKKLLWEQACVVVVSLIIPTKTLI